MTFPQIRQILKESQKIGSIEWIYFEGGEPFLYYPSMIEGIRLAKDMGFKVGIVTNGHGAVSEEDADIWLRPIAELGADYISISDDSFHYEEKEVNPSKRALLAARKLNIPCSPISISKPFVEVNPGEGQEKGKPIIGGGALFRGRAVEKLITGLPLRPWQELTNCPYEDLQSPSRVHIDTYGHVHLCQGLSMGNMWQKPLSELVSKYEAQSHPICGPLVEGGPALLAKYHNVECDQGYVDECHLCYLTRRALIDRFPEYLAPRQVYGLSQ
jgi:hypothetical protein